MDVKTIRKENIIHDWLAPYGYGKKLFGVYWIANTIHFLFYWSWSLNALEYNKMGFGSLCSVKTVCLSCWLKTWIVKILVRPFYGFYKCLILCEEPLVFEVGSKLRMSINWKENK